MLYAAILTILLVALAYKFVKWNLQYFYKLSVINKIKGLQIIPYIGNAHQLKRKHGEFNR